MKFNYSIQKIGRFWIGALAGSDGLRALTLSMRLKSDAMETMRHRLLELGRDEVHEGVEGWVAKAFEQVEAYLSGQREAFDLPLDWASGTEFHKAVWRACQRIPYGKTESYAWVAEQVGRPKSARAVGGALGANPIPLVVPCHRVLRSDGSLGGYTGGLEIKRAFLALEQNT